MFMKSFTLFAMRPRSESNRRIVLLQRTALPLGYVAVATLLLFFINITILSCAHANFANDALDILSVLLANIINDIDCWWTWDFGYLAKVAEKLRTTATQKRQSFFFL